MYKGKRTCTRGDRSPLAHNCTLTPPNPPPPPFFSTSNSPPLRHISTPRHEKPKSTPPLIGVLPARFPCSLGNGVIHVVTLEVTPAGGWELLPKADHLSAEHCFIRKRLYAAPVIRSTPGRQVNAPPAFFRLKEGGTKVFSGKCK